MSLEHQTDHDQPPRVGTAVRWTKFQGSVPGACRALTAVDSPNRWAGLGYVMGGKAKSKLE